MRETGGGGKSARSASAIAPRLLRPGRVQHMEKKSRVAVRIPFAPGRADPRPAAWKAAVRLQERPEAETAPGMRFGGMLSLNIKLRRRHRLLPPASEPLRANIRETLWRKGSSPKTGKTLPALHQTPVGMVGCVDKEDINHKRERQGIKKPSPERELRPGSAWWSVGDSNP